MRYAVTDLGRFQPVAILKNGAIVGDVGLKLSEHDPKYTSGKIGRWTKGYYSLEGLFLSKSAFVKSVNANEDWLVSVQHQDTNGGRTVFLRTQHGAKELPSDNGIRMVDGIAMNDQQVIVGMAITSNDSEERAAIFDHGHITFLKPLFSGGSPKDTVPAGINNHKQVVGWSSSSKAGAVHAFLWESGKMRDLGTLGGPTSRAKAINDAGQIAGESDTANGELHACIWENGKIRDIAATQGSRESHVGAMNRQGIVVGSICSFMCTPGFGPKAYLYKNGKMESINIFMVPQNAAWNIASAYYINDKKQMLAMGFRTVSDERKNNPTYYFLDPLPSLYTSNVRPISAH